MRSAALVLLLAACSLSAQSTLPTQFDTAVIRPAPPSGGRASSLRFDPAHLAANNVSLKQLIERAFDLKPYQVQGPAWLDRERFDVTAETQQPLTQSQMAALLQPLLVRQFDLKTHHATKLVPVYALVVAPGGLKIKAAGANGAATFGGESPPPGVIQMRAIQQGAAISLTGNVSMNRLANFLSSQMDRPVLNMTNLAGNYELHLDIAPTNVIRGYMLKPPPPPGAGTGPSGKAQAPAPTLFSALPQQLGLRLDPRKAPIQILVIDSASKTPTGS